MPQPRGGPQVTRCPVTLSPVETVIAWTACLGAWLLVAGPLYQASMELEEEEFRRDDVVAASARLVDVPPRPSPWWWLLPPVAYVKALRHNRRMRELLLASLSREELEGYLHFVSKATGWVYVGIGGLAIAAKETWEAVHHQHWPTGVFFALLLLGLLLSAFNTAARSRRSQDILERATATPAETAGHAAGG
jgi:hypothetical protein